MDKTGLFHDWMGRPARHIGWTPGRKILMLLNDCSAHEKMEQLTELQIICVELLLSNVTSKIHPLDASFIAWVNKNHWHRLLFRFFEIIDADNISIYNVRHINGDAGDGRELLSLYREFY